MVDLRQSAIYYALPNNPLRKDAIPRVSAAICETDMTALKTPLCPYHTADPV